MFRTCSQPGRFAILPPPGWHARALSGPYTPGRYRGVQMIGDKTEATSGRIRSVAAELFAEKGYGETSLREIAERLGITKAALYYHYPSKEQLLQAIVQPFFDDLRILVGHAERELPGGASLRSFFEAYLDMLLRHRAVC